MLSMSCLATSSGESSGELSAQEKLNEWSQFDRRAKKFCVDHAMTRGHNNLLYNVVLLLPGQNIDEYVFQNHPYISLSIC